MENKKEASVEEEKEELKVETTESQEEKLQEDSDEKKAEEKVELNAEEKLQSELAEQKDKFVRLYSEFENFRRRTAKEKLDLIATAGEKIIKSLLPVLDDFERAQASLDDATDAKAIAEGVNLIKDKFQKVLEAEGLKPVEAKGKVFDADLHEGITQIPAPTDDMKGKVVDEIEKGYFLGEKIIRYSKVVIGS